MNQNKQCNKCIIMKDDSEFRKNRRVCKDCERESGREYRRSNDKAKIWATNNKDKMKELQSNWHQQNKERINEKFVDRYNNDIEFKIKKNTHRRLLDLINKNKTTKHYLGTEFSFIKEWLSFSFTPEMSWDNYGTFWHIDHVIPLNTFNIVNEEEQLIAFNWTNLMPYKKEDNLSKHDNIVPEQIKVHLSNLIKFHKLKNIEINDSIIKLFAKHLVAGTPLEL